MTSLADQLAASKDEDLRNRMVAAAFEQGIPSPAQWVDRNMGALAVAKVSNDPEASDTVASVYAYAVATYEPVPRPGENPSAVTDDYIRHAVSSVYAPPQTSV